MYNCNYQPVVGTQDRAKQTELPYVHNLTTPNAVGVANNGPQGIQNRAMNPEYSTIHIAFPSKITRFHKRNVN